MEKIIVKILGLLLVGLSVYVLDRYDKFWVYFIMWCIGWSIYNLGF